MTVAENVAEADRRQASRIRLAKSICVLALTVAVSGLLIGLRPEIRDWLIEADGPIDRQNETLQAGLLVAGLLYVFSFAATFRSAQQRRGAIVGALYDEVTALHRICLSGRHLARVRGRTADDVYKLERRLLRRLIAYIKASSASFTKFRSVIDATSESLYAILSDFDLPSLTAGASGVGVATAVPVASPGSKSPRPALTGGGGGGGAATAYYYPAAGDVADVTVTMLHTTIMNALCRVMDSRSRRTAASNIEIGMIMWAVLLFLAFSMFVVSREKVVSNPHSHAALSRLRDCRYLDALV